MVLTVAFYLALSICILGILLRLFGWKKTAFSPPDDGLSAPKRPTLFIRGAAGRRVCRMALVILWDVLLQRSLLRAGWLRWLGHICLFYGFVFLTLMHALDDTVTAALFPDYASTLNPFMLLRNLFGVMVLFGVLVAVIGRVRRNRYFRATNGPDILALVLLSLIIVSGFLLESVQIFSAPIFHEMVEDYIGTDDPEVVEPLKAYWARDFHVVFPEPAASPDMAAGRMVHEENCAACHSRPGSAFVSLPLSRVMSPAALWLNQVRADGWLWYFHFGVCFAALALLPFTKFFHIISVPLNLMVAAGREISPSTGTRHGLGMDACTHCGLCSLHCSVAPIFQIIPNPDILPSEKLAAHRRLMAGKGLDAARLEELAEGSFICTECYRCTQLCPSGISLQEIWRDGKRLLTDREVPEPHGWVRRLTADQWADRLESVKEEPPLRDTFRHHRHASREPDTFTACIQCSICTNVCPVVAAGDGIEPPEVTPQQVMNLLRLDLKEWALGSRMVWDCVTCYLCQEHCPQGIRVTDILYDLRNIAVSRLRGVRNVASGSSPDNTESNQPHGGKRDKAA
ncbi:MAG: 4Fe-4S dicluster domain-containing protein [Thermodesulfobacteriota bacterium]